MSQHTQDGYVRAYRKNDPKREVFRWPAHLVAMNSNLALAPSAKAKQATTTQRVEEPTPNNIPKKEAK